MSDWAGLAWLFVLLAGNAFFVGAEFAVISARRSQVEPLAEQGDEVVVGEGTARVVLRVEAMEGRRVERLGVRAEPEGETDS